jgi:signal transduction histidine kinase
MKKVALMFTVAVLAPSMVLAWLAVRSLRDQQFLLERQEAMLWQNVVDSKAIQAQQLLGEAQRAFAVHLAAVLRDAEPASAATQFDALLRSRWDLAQVGFVVDLDGRILSPERSARPEARLFLDDNNRFLGNRETAEVYYNNKMLANNAQQAAAPYSSSVFQEKQAAPPKTDADNRGQFSRQSQARNVVPLQQLQISKDTQPQTSKITVSEAEFRQLIGQDREGLLARFVDNKLNLLLWRRPEESPRLVFGAQLSVPKLVNLLQPLVASDEGPLGKEICLAFLDDNARPVALSRPGFQASWKRPFVASEIGEALPHWEVAAYLVNPARLAQSALTLKWTLGLLIAVLILAIGVGSWLIIADLNRHLRLARQKTDFVSNVSHELKTPLTSIRMFSELLADRRVQDPAKQVAYLGIIHSEAARLTRLINNVLDFARLERGEKKYHFQECDLAALVRETAEAYRPHLEANGFDFELDLPAVPMPAEGDRDALAQVLVNLLSNAEKYSGAKKKIRVELRSHEQPVPYAEVAVLDRGLGVPAGSEKKIFEQFYRAHDSLSSGIQGSGLGLTLARQIARAHGGDVVHAPRQGGGSVFSIRLPLIRKQP